MIFAGDLHPHYKSAEPLGDRTFYDIFHWKDGCGAIMFDIIRDGHDAKRV
jgi:hypothetical protein